MTDERDVVTELRDLVQSKHDDDPAPNNLIALRLIAKTLEWTPRETVVENEHTLRQCIDAAVQQTITRDSYKDIRLRLRHAGCVIAPPTSPQGPLHYELRRK